MNGITKGIHRGFVPDMMTSFTDTPQSQPVTPTPPPGPGGFSDQQNQQFAPDPYSGADNQYFPDITPPQPEQLLLEWHAPSRPFKKRNRKYYTTIAIIVFLISLILFFAGQFLPIAVVIAVGFLSYVLSAVPPETIINQITTYGIRTDQNIYYWEEMGRFWYSEKHGQPLLHVEVARFPNQLTFLLGENQEETQEDITFILSQVLLQEQPQPTSFDKAAAWLQEKIPLDTDS
jgi:hypothetical protein